MAIVPAFVAFHSICHAVLSTSLGQLGVATLCVLINSYTCNYTYIYSCIMGVYLCIYNSHAEDHKSMTE